jgi:hypothetical protein
MNRHELKLHVINRLIGFGFYSTYEEFPSQAEVPTAPLGSTISPAVIDGVKLARKLIVEECNEELLPALDKWLEHPSLENLTEVLDGAVDTIYVVLQLCYTMDLPFTDAFIEVHASNLEKLRRGGDGNLLKRADGKILKPAGWTKPDLFTILHEHANKRARQFSLVGAENWVADKSVGEGEVK